MYSATLSQPLSPLPAGYAQASSELRIPGRGAGCIALPTGQTQLLYLRLQAQGYLTYGLSLTTPTISWLINRSATLSTWCSPGPC